MDGLLLALGWERGVDTPTATKHLSQGVVRREVDDILGLHLDDGMTILRPIGRVGVCERTARLRLADARFRKQLDDRRNESFERAVAMLADGMTKAAGRLVGLVDATDEKIALAACNTVLELGMRLRQAEEIERKVEGLTGRLYALLAADQVHSPKMASDLP